ncbi:hypothetical protein N658DRAFT_526360 [Parathielavia hyrcaniae]|uniref:Uncharacterized protein n=1 Tax=Parathielavia hyrcaniae TaxID=113614 RepID=A0AAN6PYB2_9PEZI|nr:hypothetical protein N658DRAFT_526360 [Parathielavia hyrcaniae]
MEDISEEMPANNSSRASARVICEELLKVLSRTEVEQPMICQDLCLCAQFWRYQHYLLPLRDCQRGVTKIVCFGLGSFRHTTPNGGPFFPPPADADTDTDTTNTSIRTDADTDTTTIHMTNPQPTYDDYDDYRYRDVIRSSTLRARFSARPVTRNDPLQAMLRHVAAVEMASGIKFCSSRRGIEHQLVKYYFQRLAAVQELLSPEMEGEGEGDKMGEDVKKENKDKKEKREKKEKKLPPTAGYAGDADLVDVRVYMCDAEYTDEDRDALGRLAGVFAAAHLPPVEVVVDVVGALEGGLVDERTLVYCPVLPAREAAAVLGRSRPAAVVADPIIQEKLPLLDGYVEFKLDKRRAPHTVGSSHLYIRRDLVERAEKEMIVPPYPVTFPHDYPHRHEDWYLNRLERHGSGKVVDARSREQ